MLQIVATVIASVISKIGLLITFEYSYLIWGCVDLKSLKQSYEMAQGRGRAC